jgi:hypothetical protein
MKKAFFNVSIKDKLMTVILLTSGTVLFIVSTAFIVNDAITFRQGLRQELGALADIIAKNTSAAILSGDRKAATETLQGLSVKPHIFGAFIVTDHEGLFASYISSDVRKRRRVCLSNGNTPWKSESCAVLCHTAGKVGWGAESLQE